ncbi:MAG: VanW family protein [Nocardioides sp.]
MTPRAYSAGDVAAPRRFWLNGSSDTSPAIDTERGTLEASPVGADVDGAKGPDSVGAGEGGGDGVAVEAVAAEAATAEPAVQEAANGVHPSVFEAVAEAVSRAEGRSATQPVDDGSEPVARWTPVKVAGQRMTPSAFRPGTPAPPRTPGSSGSPARAVEGDLDDDTAERPPVVIDDLREVIGRPPADSVDGIDEVDQVDQVDETYEADEADERGSDADLADGPLAGDDPDPDLDETDSIPEVSLSRPRPLPSTSGIGGATAPLPSRLVVAETEPARAEPEPAKPSRRRRKAGLLAIAGLLLLVAGAYAALYALAVDRLPRGTTISGVEVGGKAPAEAERALRAGLGTRATEPFDIAIERQSQEIDPATAGLAIDYRASIRAIPPTTASPTSLWRHYTGGADSKAVITVDRPKLTAVLDDLSAKVASPATEGAVKFKGNDYQVTTPKDGRELDKEVAAQAVRQGYLDPDADIDLDLKDAPPDVNKADVDNAVKTFAAPALTGPVTLRFGEKSLVLRRAQFLPLLSLTAKDGVLKPTARADELATYARKKIGKPGAPVDATVRLVGGRPKVIKAKAGVRYSAASMEAALVQAAASTDNRVVDVKATEQEAAFSTEDAQKLGVRRKVASFTTYYPYAPYRNVNIPRAASLINNTLVKPGETFSLNATVGERTVANGFTKGFIIKDGIFSEDLGGGVSQIATTTYNAAYFAGLADVEHYPHSFFIDRYPPGREATVAWGSKDLKFKNTTKYGVLVQAGVTKATPSSSGVVVVSIWSTKVWDVTTSASARYNLTSPGERTIKEEDCVPNGGSGGFQIDVTRYWRKPGQSKIVKKETDRTTYVPADKVICEPPDDPAP